jgi:hypothetical protein
MSHLETLLANLEASYGEFRGLLMPFADRQDDAPTPESWSYRYHAGHIATVEQECHWDRVQRISAGEQPHYDYYLNTGRDFGDRSLRDWLDEWEKCRHSIFQFVRTLTAEQLKNAGTHDYFGTINIFDVLRIMHDHDTEHIAEFKAQISVARPARSR